MKHAFVSSKAAASDSTIVDGPKWNAGHVVEAGDYDAYYMKLGAVGPFASDSLMLPAFESAGSSFAGAWLGGALGLGVIGTMQFTLNRYFTINNGGISITATSAGGFAYLGIYSLAGNRLTQFKFSTTTAGVVIVAANPAVTLAPGVYIFAITADNIVATAKGFSFDTDLVNMQFSNGVAVNALSGASMPSTLGGFSTNTHNIASWASLMILS